MQKSDFRKGQEVFLLIVEGGNEFRSVRNQPFEKRILRSTVTKVGKKYITVEHRNWPPILFDIEEDFRQVYDCSEDYKLFLTEQAAYDYQEKITLFREIREAFGWKNEEKLSLEQLKQIKNIIDNK